MPDATQEKGNENLNEGTGQETDVGKAFDHVDQNVLKGLVVPTGKKDKEETPIPLKTSKKKYSSNKGEQPKKAAPKINEAKGFVNSREGYHIWQEFAFTEAEKEKFPSSSSIEWGYASFFSRMAFDIVYRAMFAGKPYEVRFVKSHDENDCALFTPAFDIDTPDGEIEVGMFTMSSHKRRHKKNFKHGKKSQGNSGFFIKTGPTYYQLPAVTKNLNKMDTPFGKWIIAQTICEHFFFEILMSGKFATLSKIRCLLNKEPTLIENDREVPYRKLIGG